MNIHSDKWKENFMKLAKQVAEFSKDKNTHVGAFIFEEDGTPVSFGFNGFPMGVMDDVPERTERPKKYLYTAHAERNAIDLAKVIEPGCVLFCTHFPCSTCAQSIIQNKIKYVYVLEKNNELSDWAKRSLGDEQIKATLEMFAESKVSIGYI